MTATRIQHRGGCVFGYGGLPKGQDACESCGALERRWTGHAGWCSVQVPPLDGEDCSECGANWIHGESPKLVEPWFTKAEADALLQHLHDTVPEPECDHQANTHEGCSRHDPRTWSPLQHAIEKLQVQRARTFEMVFVPQEREEVS
jgi:hypothetical protein